MTLSLRRGRTNVCFCNEGCPPVTWPHYQYFFDDEFFLANPILCRFVIKLSGGECLYQNVDTLSPPDTLDLVKSDVSAMYPAGFNAWRWRIDLKIGAVTNSWQEDYVWEVANYSSPPVDPNDDKSCSQIDFQVTAVPPTVFDGLLFAAYPDACDSGDWPAKKVRKPLGMLLTD